ncbi:MAG: hypothetical protein MJ195_02815 [Mycoplasmoidaceae bacterium]|nr:hypothetical protein [Mycoplasmoidaceae bacterium]
MTILAGAAQFGVSEKNSSIRVLRETGSYTDLEGNVVPLNQTEPYPSQGGLNFILPNWEY